MLLSLFNVMYLSFCLQIHLHQNNFKLANQSLEVGLSYNFEVSTNSGQFNLEIFYCFTFLLSVIASVKYFKGFFFIF